MIKIKGYEIKISEIIVILIMVIGVVLIALYPIDIKSDIPELPDYPSGSLPPPDSESGELGIGWNLVSMDMSVNKTDVYITYDNDTYDWDSAISNGIIFHKLYGYNGSNYYLANKFIKTKGYWLYALKEPIYISSQPLILYCGKLYFDGTENITCSKIVISPDYTNEIHCNQLTVDSVEFYYDDVGVLND